MVVRPTHLLGGEPAHSASHARLIDLERLAEQYGGRIIEFERYTTLFGSVRYSAMIRRNDNDLTIDAIEDIRAQLPTSASSGLLLRSLSGSGNTIAGNLESAAFEPVSLITTAHHFVACNQVDLGYDSFSSPVIENQGLFGTYPTGSNPTTRPLQKQRHRTAGVHLRRDRRRTRGSKRSPERIRHAGRVARAAIRTRLRWECWQLVPGQSDRSLLDIPPRLGCGRAVRDVDRSRFDPDHRAAHAGDIR